MNWSTNMYTWNISICCCSSPGHTWSSWWAPVLHYGVFCTPLTVHLNARVNNDGQHYGQITVTGRAGYHEIFIEITVTYINGNGVQHMVKQIQCVCQGRHEDSGVRSRCPMHGWVITSHSILWDAITYPCLRCLLLVPKSSYDMWIHNDIMT